MEYVSIFIVIDHSYEAQTARAFATFSWQYASKIEEFHI